MSQWTIEYDNDTGDGSFREWWTVSGERSFRCEDEAAAKWLTETLNAVEQLQAENKELREECEDMRSHLDPREFYGESY